MCPSVLLESWRPDHEHTINRNKGDPILEQIKSIPIKVPSEKSFSTGVVRIAMHLLGPVVHIAQCFISMYGRYK